MKVFLNDTETEYELENEELNLEEALSEFYDLSDSEGSFFGIKTATKPIQFAWEENDKWLVDVPYDMPNGICLQRLANYDECVEIIIKIFKSISPEDIEGLVKVNVF